MSDNQSNNSPIPGADNQLNATRLLTEVEAAALLGFTRRALQNWRHRGGGPMFVRISPRCIRYRVCDLASWAEARLVANTSQYDGPF